MGTTGWVATLTFLLAVPASIWLSFEGHYLGLYGYGLVPVVFGVVVSVTFAVLLLVVLPRLNREG